MSKKKKNNQPVKVSLHKRLLRIVSRIQNYCGDKFLEVQLLMYRGKKAQKKVVKKSLTTKKVH